MISIVAIFTCNGVHLKCCICTFTSVQDANTFFSYIIQTTCSLHSFTTVLNPEQKKQQVNWFTPWFSYCWEPVLQVSVQVTQRIGIYSSCVTSQSFNLLFSCINVRLLTKKTTFLTFHVLKQALVSHNRCEFLRGWGLIWMLPSAGVRWCRPWCRLHCLLSIGPNAIQWLPQVWWCPHVSSSDLLFKNWH